MREAGLQKETMVDLLMEDRRKSIDDYNKDNAEFDVTKYLDANEQVIRAQLQKARASGIVSRETQAAVLKGMILDYQEGKHRKGLGALTALKAVELLNKMTGYEAPVEMKVDHEIKVNVLPIAEKPFTGELPPLMVSDLGGSVIPTGEVAPDIIDAEISPAPTETPESEELFP